VAFERGILRSQIAVLRVAYDGARTSFLIFARCTRANLLAPYLVSASISVPDNQPFPYSEQSPFQFLFFDTRDTQNTLQCQDMQTGMRPRAKKQAQAISPIINRSLAVSAQCSRSPRPKCKSEPRNEAAHQTVGCSIKSRLLILAVCYEKVKLTL
jgi:hypothetical protein